MTRFLSPQMLYFGKLPSRGDFVRSGHAAALIDTLDRWLSGGIEAMAVDARWKTVYDRAGAAHFAFLGTRNAMGLAGHLLASSDSSGRRFPFIAAAMLEVEAPIGFLPRSPLALAEAWQRFQVSAGEAFSAEDAGPVLANLRQSQIELAGSAAAHDARFAAGLQSHTVGSLQKLLSDAGHQMSVRTLMLGLGLLLQPVLASGNGRVDRGLRLPLPEDSAERPFVGALWLELLTGFLTRAEFEIALFMPQRLVSTPPSLVLGFDGASARTLQAVLDPEVGREVFIDACDADWVEDYVGQDAEVNKLSSYLQQPDLSLRTAVDTFKDVFLGSALP